ncbi:type II toxin-antitoxin system prevent-host-death family antitoxin [Luteolibacter ambystomatis]|uniref:Antitoxin n=1 Tax=Luteolibacter ambystomatis TaxID=2824561 RepID=A0A975G913_9BACT|nr:type II toxin-antitoxin system prevent-host-death family antitoxin [Luteolibacter ambystomatis]QUE51198.1 type II toxin-antitoxin system prevent-host-death family antitoxin [Luteolibacter ambystomatis]
MSIVSIHEAKTHLSRLIQRALEGEEIIIANRNEPMVRLQVVRESPPSRQFGGLKGLVLAMGDHFNDELEDFGDYAPPISQRVAEPKKPYRRKKP